MPGTQLVDFGSLVGSQVSALVEAEIQGAETASRFIESVGFEQDAKTGALKLRMVEFDMTRRDVDGTQRVHRVKIPALTLFPIPLLAIEKAVIDFEAKVEYFADETATGQGAATADRPTPLHERLFGERRSKKRMVTRLAKTKAGKQKGDAELKVSVEMTQSDFPLGIERLLQASDLAVQDEVVDGGTAGPSQPEPAEPQ